MVNTYSIFLSKNKTAQFFLTPVLHKQIVVESYVLQLQPNVNKKGAGLLQNQHLCGYEARSHLYQISIIFSPARYKLSPGFTPNAV
jgi:hypothetical protein